MPCSISPLLISLPTDGERTTVPLELTLRRESYGTLDLKEILHDVPTQLAGCTCRDDEFGARRAKHDDGYHELPCILKSEKTRDIGQSVLVDEEEHASGEDEDEEYRLEGNQQV